MILIPFVFNGTEAEFRALDPAPVRYWGEWHATTIGTAFVGVIVTTNPNVRAHTHPKMTFLPHHGSNGLSQDYVDACAALGVGITTGDTLSDAISKIHAASGADFLHPDRF